MHDKLDNHLWMQAVWAHRHSTLAVPAESASTAPTDAEIKAIVTTAFMVVNPFFGQGFTICRRHWLSRSRHGRGSVSERSTHDARWTAKKTIFL